MDVASKRNSNGQYITPVSVATVDDEDLASIVAFKVDLAIIIDTVHVSDSCYVLKVSRNNSNQVDLDIYTAQQPFSACGHQGLVWVNR